MAATLTHRSGAMTPYVARDDVEDLLAELDAEADSEHPDVSVTHESGWTLSAFQTGLVVWENVEAEDPPEHRHGLARDEVRRLFVCVAEGDMAQVAAPRTA